MASNNSLPLPSPLLKHSSIPITRPTGTAYERPERARTSHACEPCRERKTKCDGDRPSCRRCLHTGTSCHYGYGKGWRKRKTADDLTATSRKLDRYEALFDDILPLVPPNVEAMIKEARDQDTASSNSPGSERTESNEPVRRLPSLNSELSSSGSTSRVSLPLPLPSPLVTPGARTPLVRSFKSMSPASNPATASNSSLIPRPSSQRGSPDDHTTTRLPSIRPDGLLIEASLIQPPTNGSQHRPEHVPGFLSDREGLVDMLPASRASHGGWSDQLDHGRANADSRKRDFKSAFSRLERPIPVQG